MMNSVRNDDHIDDARVIDVNGVRLRVTVRVGSSARTPLLLANGIGASLETFEPLIEHLDPDLTVIRFDACLTSSVTRKWTFWVSHGAVPSPSSSPSPSGAAAAGWSWWPHRPGRRWCHRS